MNSCQSNRQHKQQHPHLPLSVLSSSILLLLEGNSISQSPSLFFSLLLRLHPSGLYCIPFFFLRYFFTFSSFFFIHSCPVTIFYFFFLLFSVRFTPPVLDRGMEWGVMENVRLALAFVCWRGQPKKNENQNTKQGARAGGRMDIQQCVEGVLISPQSSTLLLVFVSLSLSRVFFGRAVFFVFVVVLLFLQPFSRPPQLIPFAFVSPVYVLHALPVII